MAMTPTIVRHGRMNDIENSLLDSLCGIFTIYVSCMAQS